MRLRSIPCKAVGIIRVGQISQHITKPIPRKRALSVSTGRRLSRTAEITSDVKLEYRVDNLACDNGLVFAGETSKQWRPLSTTLELSTTERTYFSDDSGGTSADLQFADRQGELKCFQYRAFLMTGHRNYTPILLNVGLRVITDKQPDLFVDQIIPKKEGDSKRFVGLDITIRNFFAKNKTAAADFDGSLNKSFYVDLYIFAPDETPFSPKNPPPIPFVEGETTPITATHHLYATLRRDSMPANATFPSDPTVQTAWKDKWTDLATKEKVTDLSRIMGSLTKTGTYTACVIVDSFLENANDRITWPKVYVNEGDENDNWKCVPIDIEDVPVKVCVMKGADMKGNAKEQDAQTKQPVKGTYTISRTVDRDVDLEVFFNLGGSTSISETQESGKPDYQFDQKDGKAVVAVKGSLGSVVIPKGSLSVTFDFTPVDDLTQEGDENVELKIIKVAEPSEYEPEAVPDAKCYITENIIIEDNDWYIYLPIIGRQ